MRGREGVEEKRREGLGRGEGGRRVHWTDRLVPVALVSRVRLDTYSRTRGKEEEEEKQRTKQHRQQPRLTERGFSHSLLHKWAVGGWSWGKAFGRGDRALDRSDGAAWSGLRVVLSFRGALPGCLPHWNQVLRICAGGGFCGGLHLSLSLCLCVCSAEGFRVWGFGESVRAPGNIWKSAAAGQGLQGSGWS